MEAYKINFLPGLLNNLEEIAFSMASENNAAASIWYDHFIQSMDLLAHSPKIGISVPDVKGSPLPYRMLLLEDHLLIYDICQESKEIVMMHILNAKRDYPCLLAEYLARSKN